MVIQEPIHLLSYDSALFAFWNPLHSAGVEKAYSFIIHSPPEVTPLVRGIMLFHRSVSMLGVVVVVGGKGLPATSPRFNIVLWTGSLNLRWSIYFSAKRYYFPFHNIIQRWYY